MESHYEFYFSAKDEKQPQVHSTRRRGDSLSDCLYCQGCFECWVMEKAAHGASENDEAVFRFPTTSAATGD
jgi:hypothetical protein